MMILQKTFPQAKMRYVAPILEDFAKELLSQSNSFEIKENYAQRFESIKEYCDFVLDQYAQSRKDYIRSLGKRK